MATNNANNIALGAPKIGGAIFVAPKGTECPTDATSPLGDLFQNVGYCSEDGLKRKETITKKPVVEWGGSTVRQPLDKYEATWSFGMLETSTLTKGVIHGEKNVEGDDETGFAVVGRPEYRSEHAWVIEQILDDGWIRRTVIYRGDINDIAEVASLPKDPETYNITLSGMANGEGITYREYYRRISNDVVVTPPDEVTDPGDGETGDTNLGDDGNAG